MHRDNVRAGADLITTATFGLNSCSLAGTALEGDGANLVMRAAGLARQAIQDASSEPRPRFVAGSMGPIGDCYDPRDRPPDCVCRAAHREQAAWLAAAEVDLILIETIPATDEMAWALEAAAAAERADGQPTPVILAFYVAGMGAEDLRRSVDTLLASPGSERVVGVAMSCGEPAHILSLLPVLVAATGGRLPLTGVYPNAEIRDPVTAEWVPRHDFGPRRFAAWARAALTDGANLIGGCCGTSPAHVLQLNEMLDSYGDTHRPTSGE